MCTSIDVLPAAVHCVFHAVGAFERTVRGPPVQMDHENIVKLYEFFEEKHFYYLVMEILNGGELFDRIVLKQYYNEKEARRVCVPAIGGIALPTQAALRIFFLGYSS